MAKDWICVCNKDSQFFLDQNIWVGDLDEPHICFEGCRSFNMIASGQKEHDEDQLEIQETGMPPGYEKEVETTSCTNIKKKLSDKWCAACGSTGHVLDFQVRELYADKSKAVFIHEFSETNDKGMKMRLFCILGLPKGRPRKFAFLKQDKTYSEDTMALMNITKKMGEEQDESYTRVGRLDDASTRETTLSTRSRQRSLTSGNDMDLAIEYPEIFGNSDQDTTETRVSPYTGHLDSPTDPLNPVLASLARNKRVQDFGLPANNKRVRVSHGPTNVDASLITPAAESEVEHVPRARITIMGPPSGVTSGVVMPSVTRGNAALNDNHRPSLNNEVVTTPTVSHEGQTSRFARRHSDATTVISAGDVMLPPSDEPHHQTTTFSSALDHDVQSRPMGDSEPATRSAAGLSDALNVARNNASEHPILANDAATSLTESNPIAQTEPMSASADLRLTYCVTEQEKLTIEDLLERAGMNDPYEGQPRELIQFKIQFELVLMTSAAQQSSRKYEYGIIKESPASATSVREELITNQSVIAALNQLINGP